jgi:hypothetical protein
MQRLCDNCSAYMMKAFQSLTGSSHFTVLLISYFSWEISSHNLNSFYSEQWDCVNKSFSFCLCYPLQCGYQNPLPCRNCSHSLS